MDEDDRRRHGWDAAVTLVTPIPRRRATRWKRKVILGALDRDWLIEAGGALGLVPFPPLDDQFKRFNHLHYARWSLVDRLPHTSPHQPRESGPYTVLVFTSHFDFGWRRYLGTFIEAIGNGLQHLWGDSPSWRRPDEGFRRFESFVEGQRVGHAHLFAAYPNWSCNDVRCALRIHQDCESFDLGRDVLHDRLGVDVSDEARRRGLVRRLQYCLGHLSPIDPDYDGVAAGMPLEQPDPTHGVTYLAPLPLDAAPEVAELLLEMPFGPRSPFAGVPGTHFARMSLIDKRYFDRQPRVDPLRSAYLLLSAEIDGDPDHWLRTLFSNTAMRRLLSRCWGFDRYPHPEDFLRRCRVAKSTEYIDYPMTTVADIFTASEALATHLEELRQ